MSGFVTHLCLSLHVVAHLFWSQFRSEEFHIFEWPAVHVSISTSISLETTAGFYSQPLTARITFAAAQWRRFISDGPTSWPVPLPDDRPSTRFYLVQCFIFFFKQSFLHYDNTIQHEFIAKAILSLVLENTFQVHSRTLLISVKLLYGTLERFNIQPGVRQSLSSII